MGLVHLRRHALQTLRLLDFTHLVCGSQFYQEDIVKRKDNLDPAYGVVLRSWHDAEDVPLPPDHLDPLMRPLKRGEVGVSFFSGGARDILPESMFTLVDRMFQPGDLCKKSINDVQSGVVTSVDVRARLDHAISGEHVPGWKTMDDIESPADVDIGDYVTYDHWIGQLFDEAVIDVSDGKLARLPEISSRLSVGDMGSDIIPHPSTVSNLFGGLFGRHNSVSDTVVHVKHTVLAVSWLAIDQSLPPETAAGASRPQRFWHGEDMGKLKLVRSRAEQMMRVADKVTLRDGPGIPYTVHGKAGEPWGLIQVRVYVVRVTQSTVHVLWQDGSTETLLATELIPYLNPDEYDCWPGDHVLWKGEDEKRAAVVQSVNARDRTADVVFSDTDSRELVSVLELDPHGTGDWSATSPTTFDGLGLRRGDFVFIGESNGMEPPRVPRIGEVEMWVREAPVMDERGQLGGWRKEMSDMGHDIARKRETEKTVEGKILRPSSGDTSLNWFGEVSDRRFSHQLRLDGSVEVTFPNGLTAIFPLQRLTRLYDTMEQLEDIWGDEMQGETEEGRHPHEEDFWAMDEDGNWQQGTGEDDEDWEEEDEEGNEDMTVDEEGWDFDPEAQPPATDATPNSNINGVPDVPQPSHIPDAEAEDSPWKRFEVISEAPPDHAFYSSVPSQPSRQFLARLQKEYRALTNSLPDSIIVRAYEDRSDLLRSLIIGPENTPYEDAPFVIDWMLDSNFPQSPPIAHFLSWTNGNGRVNPNLYEEGKVCLSILGTWAGDRNESWSPARSSLLQALVSIQGLVLVKEPWFCEPAYDKLRGTEEGIVNSRLYSEKAYVLSRGFVRRSLEIPLGSLEAEITWLYRKQGRLEKVIKDARALIEKSQSSDDTAVDRERAVPRLTAGGIITLGRTLGKLEGLQSMPPS
ncbi:uncharacterized protein STEHIDRAFT_47908 [Stereum hirsutum FP-91666 SS1]|uniref:uncharacterized protein n=1 Tax=Stereum hirsutum (strain FP-91666) TaxID=721885 RepID=UPI000440C342|nr:uncharacterized protein STEHIDRAFT_47908 [Stereum hirsutum FP-91666 SS1]EIM92129.1 hypothetical protein STEHIDRAFT_47908 [Stereum hirsutum FP-91666 SS1]